MAAHSASTLALKLFKAVWKTHRLISRVQVDFSKWERVTTLGFAESDGGVASPPFADFSNWALATMLRFAEGPPQPVHLSQNQNG